MRNLLSYYKIQKAISVFKRNKPFLNSIKNTKGYLDVGCGNNFSTNFTHLDFHWMPGVEVCWNFSSKALPFNNNVFKGIFSEHCLEHIPYDRIPFVLKEFHRVLQPGGTARIVVPDGELYLWSYSKIKNGEKFQLPFQGTNETVMERVNGIFRNHGHRFIYDFETFEVLLKNAGFSQVVKKDFREGIDKVLLKDLEWRRVESLYLEAYKA